ncbi:hypothetical protein SAMN05421853_10275 [Roseivivax halotolerans]|uniref:SMODS and SLOG-associating 2TM effector domain-containing protein n=1 Tax=Roseivivax halotolerans TaxID=93684 RepID=A0A1I5W1V5_9RHOB|nr:hypothetical protein [Roseivivax halotolerans]SFQ13643.1 hypothetical protein SAMN05421853_10275 [Roseivivax halotolerans]
MNDREIIRFNVLRNALYHTARRRWLERANRICNLLVILLGTAVVADLAARAGAGALYIGGAVAFIGALQLVLDFGRQARDHQILQRDYYVLLSEIEKLADPTEADLAHWRGRMFEITAEEPPTLRAIDAKAYNDALDAVEVYDQGERLVVPFLHRIAGSFLSFDGHTYRKVSEAQAG